MNARSLALAIGLGFLLGASAARAQDAQPAPTKVADVAGVWNSTWGLVTLQTTPGTDGKTQNVRGAYDSSTGASRTGHIKSGTFDPATGILEFALEEPWWDNDTKGTAKLALAADGRKFEGPYLKTNKDGGRDEGTVTLTHMRDIAGLWDSAWGRVTLQIAPGTDGKTLNVQGSYDSVTGADNKGLIRSGTFDPTTGILAFALEEPWWGNETKGTAKLTLAADGQKFEGPYLKTNNGGGRDEGTVTLTHLANVAGVWQSSWGLVTLRTAPADGNKFSVTGFYLVSYYQTGFIKSGSFDPATGSLEIAYESPWYGNDTKGTAKLQLAADGQKLAGPYLTTNKDGGRDEGVVTFTLGRDPARPPADPAGLWDSPWGLITLQSSPIPGTTVLSVSGSYESNSGPNRTGIIRSGVFDPATGILDFALEEPWWGNQTNGSAHLTLDDAGIRFQGLYAKTNQGGDKDEGVVSLIRLSDRNFAAAVDSAFADAGIKADTPGAAVEVIDHGKVVFSKCAGLARLTDKKPITPQTVFELCSVSKSFTGAAILRLYEQGKLNLDDDIRKFIPEMPVYDAKNPIRILHVARMTSGLPDIMYAENVKSKNPDYWTNEDFAGEFARQLDKFPLKYPTGQDCEYSNTGYMVLGLIVERASKQRYSAFLKKEFFDPLGMKTAGVTDTASSMPPREAFAYVRENGVFQFGCGPPAIMPKPLLLPVGHSCVYASLDDMVRWDAGWRQGRIIKPATQKLALVPSTYGDNKPNDYAFGWGVTITNGKLSRMEHNGAYAGFLTYIERDVAHQRTLVVLCNSGSLDVAILNRAFDEMLP